MINYFFLVVGFILTFSIGQLSAQSYAIQIQQFTTEDGLLHRSVSAIFEDNNGFIWLGFKTGLQRFDGHEFKSWTKANTNHNVFEITSIAQDQAGWLWLWNNDLEEFTFFNPVTEDFLSEEERFGKDFPIKRGHNRDGWHNSSSYLHKDSKGRFYFTNSQPHELIVFDTAKGFEHIPLTDLKSDFLELYLIDSQDHIWLTESFTGSTLYKMNLKGEILASFNYPNSYDVAGFGEQNQTIFYQVTNDKIRNFYKIDESGQPLLLSIEPREYKRNRYICSLTWIYSPKGWEAFGEDWEQPLFTILQKDIPKALTDMNLQLFEDSRGRTWFPSAWGLGRVIAKPSRFQQYFSFEKEKPLNNSARGILVDKDTIYANFEFGGLVRMPKAKPEEWVLLEQGTNEGEYKGRPIAKAETGGVYTGHQYGIVWQTIPKEKKKVVITAEEESQLLSPPLIWSFYKDQNKRLWIGLMGLLAYKDPGEDVLHYVHSKSLKIKNNVIYHISPAEDGKLWLCGSESIYLFDPETKSYIATFGAKETGDNYLPALNFHYMYTDDDGLHWVGTNEGLLRWDRKNKEKRMFTRIDGLSNDVVYAIFEDKHHRLWLSSDYGIMQFDKATFNVNTYLEEDGITFNEFNRISAFQEEDGTIYFGGLNGITAFHPDDFYKSAEEQPYKMQITGFEIFDGEASKLLDKVGEIRTSNKITFHADDRFFRLKFVLPVIEDIGHLSYAWKVEGVDEDWNYQKENTLQIGKLPYGNHILRVKGQSSNGHWSEHELAIDVAVLRPFYLQTWFLILALLSLFGGVFLFFKRRTHQFKQTRAILETEIQKATTQIQEDKKVIEEQADELRQLDKVKSRFFANVSHELRTPLTLILGPISSAIKRGQLDNRDFTLLTKAQQNGKDLLKLIASILDLSKMESGKMELNEQPALIFPFVRRLTSTFESHAEQSGIRLTFNYKAEKDLQLELDKEKLEVILNNLLSNAIKFTPREGKISFLFEDNASAIKITLTDTGRGIHPNDLPYVFDRFYQSKEGPLRSEGGTGIGLALSQEFAKMMEGHIEVESELGVGSTFFVQLPRKEVLGTVKAEIEPVPVSIPVTNGTKVVPCSEAKTNTILVVEDNHSLRDYLQTILLPYYNILTAENGEAALQQIKTNGSSTIRLILSDIMMPIMDGYQLLEKVKSDDSLRGTPIIMLTARADLKDKLRALRIGVDDYLLKPFEEEELLVRIENLLRNYEERKAFAKENGDQLGKITEVARPEVSVEDQLWLERCEAVLNEQLDNPNYSVSEIAFEFSMSESTLARQIKRLTGLSPFRYLQELRLSEARRILENHEYNTVAQVASKVGFTDTNAFSRAFKKRFGKAPSAFANV